jgi:hypothetical protein
LLDDRHLELASVFARREPAHLPKCKREVSLTRESATVCDLRNAQIRFAEQSAGALDSPIQQVAMRRHARGCAKRPEEITLEQASMLGDAPPALDCGASRA